MSLCRLGFFVLAVVAWAGATSLRAEEAMLDPTSLVGEHICRGRNPDGSSYEGKIRIRVKNGLVLVQWDINGKLSYGTGLVEGMTLGVALENGVAIYQVFPQTDGKSLIGLWATEGARKANEESIFIGNTDIENVRIPMEKFNGTYRMKGKDAEAAEAVISGGDIIKKILLKSGQAPVEAEGLALGDGLAVITPNGLWILQRLSGNDDSIYLGGSAIDKAGKVREISLLPR